MWRQLLAILTGSLCFQDVGYYQDKRHNAVVTVTTESDGDNRKRTLVRETKHKRLSKLSCNLYYAKALCHDLMHCTLSK